MSPMYKVFYGSSVLAVAGALVLTAPLAWGRSPLPTSEAPANLVVKDFIGTVNVRLGSELSFDLDMAKSLVARPDIAEMSGALHVVGDPDADVRSCGSRNGKVWLKLKGGEKHNIEDFPTLTVTVPANSVVDLGIADGLADIADVKSLNLAFSGCGTVKYGEVSGIADVGIYGSGTVRGGDVGQLKLNLNGSGDAFSGDSAAKSSVIIKGSGDVVAGRFPSGADMQINGSGDIKTEEISGPSSLIVKGSGDIEVEQGHATELSIQVMGSGDVEFNGEADVVSVLLKGSGDVYVARSNGERNVQRLGSGNVRIGD